MSPVLLASVEPLIRVGPRELLVASGLLVFAGVLTLLFEFGLLRKLAIGGVRTVVQLLALGLLLHWLLDADSAPRVLILLFFMAFFAGVTATGRIEGGRRLLPVVTLAMLIAGTTVTFVVTAVVLRVDPWWQGRYLIPIGGMVLGNSLNGVALALERLLADLRQRRAEVVAYLSLGATPWEAALPSSRIALRAGLIPTLNAMTAVGLVFIPGMMTGHILAGTDPTVAAGYQIIVMFMLAAASTLACVVSILLSYRWTLDRLGFFEAGPEVPREGGPPAAGAP